MKYFSSITFLLFWVSQLHGQQLEQYTQFSINPYLINPAIAGTEDFLHLQAGYRNQWSGFEGAPETGYLSAHSTLNNRQLSVANKRREQISRVALGLVLLNDQTGPLEQSSGMLTFAYNFALNNQGLRISFGLNGGLKQFSYNPDGFTENLLDLDDPTLLELEDRQVLQLAAGFWLYNDHFFLGGSSFQLVNSIVAENTEPTADFTERLFPRHYYFMGGLKLDLGNEAYFVPAVLLKTLPDAAISFDITSKIVFADQFWLGANYRKEDSFGLFGGFLVKDRLEISLSYDFVLSSIRNASAGSSEIHVGYRIFNQNKVNCPDRFW
ncbi:MAG: PorP/SprF family type IX secretion system membrane protein [Bacteroidota bacterium]